jgi:hypothetical protein
MIPFLQWHYTSADARNFQTSNGFAPVPDAWFGPIIYLVTQSSSAFDVGGSGKCVGKPGVS